jgi:hypothetical protein
MLTLPSFESVAAASGVPAEFSQIRHDQELAVAAATLRGAGSLVGRNTFELVIPDGVRARHNDAVTPDDGGAVVRAKFTSGGALRSLALVDNASSVSGSSRTTMMFAPGRAPTMRYETTGKRNPIRALGALARRLFYTDGQIDAGFANAAASRVRAVTEASAQQLRYAALRALQVVDYGIVYQGATKQQAKAAFATPWPD